MQLSAHNIISRIKDSDKYFIINLLSGEADIISEESYQELVSGEVTHSKDYLKKGYLADPAAESALYRRKYLEFLDNREQDELQIFFVPSYQCNFQCSYCYQDQYQYNVELSDRKVLNSFFDYIDETFYKRKKYLTLFGGEPLLPDKYSKNFIARFIEKADDRLLDIAVVTNGYYLKEFIPDLLSVSVREIQVTLDGVGEMHDKRRPLRGGGSTFINISEGIDAALEAGLPVNLRMVLDKENIHDLPLLAAYAIKKGWTTNPVFKTQLGRNYELHHCQAGANRLYSRIRLYEDIYHLIKKHPEILEFHKPAFSVAKFLFEEGKLPDPLFDSCPGTKTEWAFDYTGKIFSCTANVGKEGEALGTFYPERKLDKEKIAEWESRDVLAIKECTNCNLRLACGAGCAAVAKNQTGQIIKPDCRPVRELLELGIATYFKDDINESKYERN
jgi:uncharacterized protein